MKISWKDSYGIGEEKIDIQHQKLVSILNYLVENKEVLKIEELRECFKELIHYANFHFRDEEELMARISYPDFMQHKMQHRYFMDQLEKIEVDLELEKTSSCHNMITFLSNWFLEHVLIKDREFSLYILQ